MARLMNLRIAICAALIALTMAVASSQQPSPAPSNKPLVILEKLPPTDQMTPGVPYYVRTGDNPVDQCQVILRRTGAMFIARTLGCSVAPDNIQAQAKAQREAQQKATPPK